jgi:DNA primase
LTSPADYDPGPDPEPEWGETGPRQRTASGALASGYSNLAQSAIALLLHQPDISRLANPRQLAELEGDDVDLLRELLALLHRRPESNTAMLLGHWYGTPEGELLSRLAGQERLIPSEGIERQFMDIMGELEHLPQRSKLAAQVDKLRVTNYAEVSGKAAAGQQPQQALNTAATAVSSPVSA